MAPPCQTEPMSQPATVRHQSMQANVIGILGGTGPQGTGLARRFAAAGLSVVIGSRDAARAEAVAAGIGPEVRGACNHSCARRADIVIVAVPWAGHEALLTELRQELVGKLVVDCVNNIGFDEQGPYAPRVEEGSAAQQAAALLPESTVTAAFHHVSAVHLNDPGRSSFALDVMVLGDDRAATDTICTLAAAIPGMRGIYSGRLRNAGQVEALAANLIAINRRYRAHASLRISDV
jgi:8-hydroxy-5-deazaflavin:NADPH oxidoreductase